VIFTTHRFEHASTFPCSVEELFALHEEVGIVRRLLPPWDRITLVKMPESLRPGTTAIFENRLGPFRFRWEVVHREYEPPHLFSDEQVRGPFASWFHRHVMEPAPEGVVLRDVIDYRLPLEPLTTLLYPLMDARLRRSFAYRHSVTRKFLQRKLVRHDGAVSSGGNYRFDLNEWMARFSADELRSDFGMGVVTGPLDLCQIEASRRSFGGQVDWGEPQPTDVFVMADGEPPDRHVTKLGGLPYRPADAPWPATEAGKPLQFLAQINFTDSRDIVGELPGDLLLVFQAEGDWEQTYLEWQPLGLTDLARAEHLPPSDFPFLPCYGYICRTAAYPNAVGASDATARRDGHARLAESEVACFQATQIGAAPYFIQDSDPDELPGRILCTLSSVIPNGCARWHWVNWEHPLSQPGDPYLDSEYYLELGDMGCLYISIDDAGQLHSHESCY